MSDRVKLDPVIGTSRKNKVRTENNSMQTYGDLSPCIMCVQYIGGCSVHRGVFSTSGGYHEYIGGDTMNTSGGYHDERGGIS